jgi:hypothetical protein
MGHPGGGVVGLGSLVELELAIRPFARNKFKKESPGAPGLDSNRNSRRDHFLSIDKPTMSRTAKNPARDHRPGRKADSTNADRSPVTHRIATITYGAFAHTSLANTSLGFDLDILASTGTALAVLARLPGYLSAVRDEILVKLLLFEDVVQDVPELLADI